MADGQAPKSHAEIKTTRYDPESDLWFELNMHTALAWIARLVVFAASCAGLAFAEGHGPTRFDLVCNGTMEGMAWKGPTSATFTTHFQVDLDKKSFCNEDYCGPFSEVDGSKLAYHCQAVDGGRFCGRLPVSTAGPFISREDFVIDLSDGSFHRTSSGRVGDIRSRPYGASYSGRCTPAPFTGLSSPNG